MAPVMGKRMDGSHKSGDASGGMPGDASGDGRWLTYGELAQIRGISKASAERMVFRNGWRRQKDNQRIVRALVPVDRLTGDASGEPSRDKSGDRSGDASGDASGIKAGFRDGAGGRPGSSRHGRCHLARAGRSR